MHQIISMPSADEIASLYRVDFVVTAKPGYHRVTTKRKEVGNDVRRRAASSIGKPLPTADESRREYEPLATDGLVESPVGPEGHQRHDVLEGARRTCLSYSEKAAAWLDADGPEPNAHRLLHGGWFLGLHLDGAVAAEGGIEFAL